MRGIYRLKNFDVLPGDKVQFSKVENSKGIVEEIRPRKNRLSRPSIANADQVLIVSSFAKPKPDLFLIDRLLVLVEYNRLVPIIIFNKVDLLTNDKMDIPEKYKKIGYKTIISSAKKGIGVEEIKKSFSGKVSVLAGPSGVGKSSILNLIEPNLSLEVGEISSKLKRGKHTTKHVSLLMIGKGLVADTPGFSKLFLPSDMPKEELSVYFPDIFNFQQYCKFSTCFHNKEPNCAVKRAVADGEIIEWRYKNYLKFLEEVISNERSF